MSRLARLALSAVLLACACAAHAEQFATFGEYEVHYNAFRAEVGLFCPLPTNDRSLKSAVEFHRLLPVLVKHGQRVLAFLKLAHCLTDAGRVAVNLGRLK